MAGNKIRVFTISVAVMDINLAAFGPVVEFNVGTKIKNKGGVNGKKQTEAGAQYAPYHLKMKINPA